MKKLIGLLILGVILNACDKNSAVNSNVNSSNGGTGKGGSLARFTILGNYLYTVDGANLSVFDIAIASNPVFKNKVNIGRDIEAIYPFKNKLFIASNTAMYVYNVSSPTQPTLDNYVQHITGCDPIVANDSIAFLTVHGGTRCGSTINQLQVYNIKNLYSPDLIETINMTNPYGLGLKNNVLFVCDNGVGLRAYDVSNPYHLNPLYIESGENFLDVIPLDSTMVCMLSNGMAFYDIADLNHIVKLSTVKN